MAINYNCDLATEASPHEVSLRLQDLLGGTVDVEGDLIRVEARAVHAVISTDTDAVAREWFLEDWKIDSKIRISFTLNRSSPNEEYIAGRRDFSIASVRLGEDLNTDAILRFEADRLMMRRQNGALTLYDWWPDWTDPQVIAKLPPGYTIMNDGQDA